MKIEIAWVPFLPVFINDTGPFTFVLDTGYAGPNLSRHAASALSLAPDDDDHVRLEKLSIGDISYEGFEIFVADNTAPTEILGRTVDGFIGMGLLKFLETTIDYPASNVSFRRITDLIGKKYVVDPEISYVRTKYISNYIIVPVSINENGPYDFLLDTGARGCSVSRSVANELGLDPGAGRAARTGEGTWDVHDSRAEAIKVGTKSVKDILVTIIDDEKRTKFTGSPIDGILGHSFLGKFKLVFNAVELFVGLG